MWCYLFYKIDGREEGLEGHRRFLDCPVKEPDHNRPLGQSFPRHRASTKNQPMPYVTTKTVAHIFALVIDCVTVFHQDSPHSRTLQHEASILKELDTMPPEDFRSELRSSLTNFYENILKRAGAGGRPVAMPLSHKFVTKAASLPASDPAAGAAGDDKNVEVPRADADAAAPVQAPAAAEAAAAPPAPAAPPTPPQGGRASRGGGKPRAS
jgi:hypothetical protein